MVRQINMDNTFVIPFGKKVTIEELSQDNDLILLCDMSQTSTLVFESVFTVDLYATFKCIWDSKPVVVKFSYADCSDENNEFEVLRFLNDLPNSPLHYTKFPLPYARISSPKYSNYKIGDILISDVWKILIYEYIPGVPLSNCVTLAKSNMYDDIHSRLLFMHSLGFIYGDVLTNNIIQTPDGNYMLIDYGEIPTAEEDIVALNIANEVFAEKFSHL